MLPRAQTAATLPSSICAAPIPHLNFNQIVTVSRLSAAARRPRRGQRRTPPSRPPFLAHFQAAFFSHCPTGTSFSIDQIGARTSPWIPLAEVHAGALDAFVLAPWPAPSRSPWSLRASCEASRGIGGPLPPAAAHGLGSLLVRACYCACCVLTLLNCHFSEVPAAVHARGARAAPRGPLTGMPLRQGGDNRLKLLPSRMGWGRSSLRCSPSTLPP